MLRGTGLECKPPPALWLRKGSRPPNGGDNTKDDMMSIQDRLNDHANNFDREGPTDNPGAYPDLYREAAGIIDSLCKACKQLADRYASINGPNDYYVRQARTAVEECRE